jgi:iron complex transport system substrate-binding protein
VERRQVLVVLQRSPLVVVGDGNLVDELLGLAGAQNAARGLGAWPRLSLEYVVKTSPEVILDTAMGKEEAPDLSFYEGLGLAAVRQGRVYAVKLDEILRPGPRIATGLEKLARLIHPEIESPMAAEREGGP